MQTKYEFKNDQHCVSALLDIYAKYIAFAYNIQMRTQHWYAVTLLT